MQAVAYPPSRNPGWQLALIVLFSTHISGPQEVMLGVKHGVIPWGVCFSELLGPKHSTESKLATPMGF